MRSLRILGALLCAGVTCAAQGLPPQQQQAVTTAAERAAADLAFRSAGLLGIVGPEGDAVIQRWDRAIAAWKKEKDAGGAPWHAEGVLFDCLSRFSNVQTRVLSSETGVPYFSDLAAERPRRAVKAFDAAKARGLTTEEGTFRAARIRALSGQDAHDLDILAASAADPIRYLASVTRAEAAQRRNDHTTAVSYYQRALALMPNSVVAPLALSLLDKTQAARALTAPMDAVDPYYTYPCIVLSTPVATELRLRIERTTIR